jgi:hypothetical protein
MSVQQVESVSISGGRYRIDVTRAPAGNWVMLEGTLLLVVLCLSVGVLYVNGNGFTRMHSSPFFLPLGVDASITKTATITAVEVGSEAGAAIFKPLNFNTTR